MSDLASVILDLDGTLADSERHGHRVAFNRAFEEFGLPDRWEEDHYGELQKISGGKERLRHHLGGRGMPDSELEELVPSLHSKKNEFFLELVKEGRVPARAGAARLLDELRDEGLRLAIATTGSPDWVQPLLDGLFGSDRFEMVLTAEDAPSKKPDPQVFHVALERLDLAPEAAIVLEDSGEGLEAAKAASLPCIVVVNDYTKDDELDGADLVVDGFGEPEARAKELSNPHSVSWDGLLDVELIREVHRRATTSR